MLVQDFYKTLEAKNRGQRTIISLKGTLDVAEKFLNKPLEDAEYNDLLRFMEYLKANGNNTNSLNLKGSQIMQFLRYCLTHTDDEKYSRLIRKFKDVIAGREKNDINPQDLLTPEDIKRAINVATLERDRCIISVLYEGGFRISELIALTISMVELNEKNQEVIFHIPNLKGRGCKTGARHVVCLEVYPYVVNWLKCHPKPLPSEKFINISLSGVQKQVQNIFNKAGISKPSNLHNFRHSAITNSCNIQMQPNKISMRYWGIPNSNMLGIYLHLSEMMVSDGYRTAKGMGNGNGTVIINPLVTKCVSCGKHIQSGSLCQQCEDTKKLREENLRMQEQIKFLQNAVEEITSNVGTILVGNEIAKNLKLTKSPRK